MTHLCSPVPAQDAHVFSAVMFVAGVAVSVATATLTWIRDLTPEWGRWWLDHLGVMAGYVLGSALFIGALVTWSTPC